MIDSILATLNLAALVIGWMVLGATFLGVVLAGLPDGPGVKGVTSLTWYDWGVVIIRNAEMVANLRARGYRLREIKGIAFGISKPRWFNLLLRRRRELKKKPG